MSDTTSAYDELAAAIQHAFAKGLTAALLDPPSQSTPAAVTKPAAIANIDAITVAKLNDEIERREHPVAILSDTTGNPSLITGDVAVSSIFAKKFPFVEMWLIETEHGTLYLDGESIIHIGEITNE